MSKALSYSKTGTKHEATVALDKAIFGVEANHELVDLAYRAYLAAGRVAGATTLTRGLVRGGGRKPWKQKGTGRARVGSIRVPNWRGGGVVFGPTGNENHTLNISTKAKRAAIRQALSLKAEAGNIAVIEAFESKDGKAKATAELLSKIKAEGRILLVLAEGNDLARRATSNVAGLTCVTAKYLNVFTVLNADLIIIETPALDVIKTWLGGAE